MSNFAGNNRRNQRDPLPLADRCSDLERQSIRALNEALPVDRFLVRDVRTEDYGVDAMIELRDNRRVTNLITQVQIKATDRTDTNGDGTISLPVPVANLNYLTNGPCGPCSLYILYVASTGRLRYAWAADEGARIDAGRKGRQQDTVTIRFGPSSLSDAATLDEIYDRVLSHGATAAALPVQKSPVPRRGKAQSGWDDDDEHPGGCDDPDRLVSTEGRIKKVRADLALDLPLFAKLLSHPDQRALARIEAGKDQAPMWLVRRVAELSGARAEWIELGAGASRHFGNRYRVRHISLHCAPEDLADILEQRPKHLYLCLEPRTKRVILAVQRTEYNWRTYEMGALNFWIWNGSRFYIPKVRAFLQGAIDVEKTLVNYYSCYLPWITMRRILAGDVHPMKGVRAAADRALHSESRRGKYWTEDFVDLHNERGVSDTEEDYTKEYGAWFVKARQMMRDWDGVIHPFEMQRLAREEEEIDGEATTLTVDQP